jgi:exonuclease VII small subunit
MSQSAAKYQYSYEAALKQLNIKPEELSITDESFDRQPEPATEYLRTRQAEQQLQQLTSQRLKTLEQII